MNFYAIEKKKRNKTNSHFVPVYFCEVEDVMLHLHLKGHSTIFSGRIIYQSCVNPNDIVGFLVQLIDCENDLQKSRC